MGLLLYDWLGGFITLPKSRYVNLNQDYGDNPIKSIYQNGYEYSDLQIDDARLVLLNAQDAINRGAKFTPILVSSKLKGLKLIGKLLLAIQKLLNVKVLINASGPFVLDVLKNICNIDTKKSLRLVQGSHIIVKKLYEGDQAYILQLEDKNNIFNSLSKQIHIDWNQLIRKCRLI